MIKWKKYKKGKGLFAEHIADSKLKCSCGSTTFVVRITEDGDIYCQCIICNGKETIAWN